MRANTKSTYRVMASLTAAEHQELMEMVFRLSTDPEFARQPTVSDAIRWALSVARDHLIECDEHSRR